MSYGRFTEFWRMTRSEVCLSKGIRIKLFILLYRLSSFGHARGGLVRAAMFPVYVLYRVYGEFLLGIELPAAVMAGPGLAVYHGHGLVVHGDTRIGARCLLRQGVTIGNKVSRDGRVSGAPVIGDDVEFGAGAVVVGNIRIGSRVTIGACTVVTRDVPDDCMVVGNGVRVIPKQEKADAQAKDVLADSVQCDNNGTR